MVTTLQSIRISRNLYFSTADRVSSRSKHKTELESKQQASEERKGAVASRVTVVGKKRVLVCVILRPHPLVSGIIQGNHESGLVSAIRGIFEARMHLHCVWGTCKTDSRRPETGVSFIPFPKPWINLKTAKRWSFLCGRGKDFTVKHITRNTYICSKHFERNEVLREG